MPRVTAFPDALLAWYSRHGRDLAWRHPGTTAWGVLLSEVMSQQTPVARVEPQWKEWMRRWPTPTALASASKEDVLRAWGRLGYPRRALRLKECAQALVERHGGEVPSDVASLLALTGIGDYTARAVACFHYGRNVPVVDTNVRRVYRRWQDGLFLAGSPRRADLAAVERLIAGRAEGPRISVALMELGALVCTARAPRCAACPLASDCAWVAAGKPEPTPTEVKRKRVQTFAGTDRQVRGIIMAHLRDSPGAVPVATVDPLWRDAEQRSRALRSLLADGLAELTEDSLLRLPR